jgi:hypothetical protein
MTQRFEGLPCAAAAVTLGAIVAMNSTAAIKTLDTITGDDLAAIQKSLPIARRHRVDIDACKIDVVSSKSYIGVVYECGSGDEVNRKTLGVRLQPESEMPEDEVARALSDPAAFKLRGHLQGASLAPILAGLSVFEKRGFQLSHYQVELLREKNSYLVNFVDKDSKLEGLGNPGTRLGLEVELNAGDLSVIRSNFIR